MIWDLFFFFFFLYVASPLQNEKNKEI